MIHHPRSTFNEIDVDEPVSVVDEDDPASHLLPIQWPQPQNEEIFLAMEEAEFEEKKRRESLRRKKLRVIEEEDGDGNSNTGSCTDHIPEDKHHPLAGKDGDSQEEHVQVSNMKKPLFFYVNLAKREICLVDLVLVPERSLAFICPPKCLFVFQIEQFEKVSESILCDMHCVRCRAITMVVTISEILKNTGLTTEKKVLTSTVGMNDEAKGNMIEIVLGKSDKFDSLVPHVTNGKTP
ncbi:unnamed protein product [Brassica oleracea var. botrytis]|uniref:BnaCnng25360D protein n=4 Tax=Brassica TaxID=3705 RepID=A0A078IU84_BRANA|nr:hypothetical protein HID58_061493 [Brassica napus]CAF1857851.1 unnamed protein product [Brassica napus]CDY53532.1 BnaCnng25360D [Brassica napus]VDD11082.1 unnamed protein product [Brassica oleracea]